MEKINLDYIINNVIYKRLKIKRFQRKEEDLTFSPEQYSFIKEIMLEFGKELLIQSSEKSMFYNFDEIIRNEIKLIKVEIEKIYNEDEKLNNTELNENKLFLLKQFHSNNFYKFFPLKKLKKDE